MRTSASYSILRIDDGAGIDTTTWHYICNNSSSAPSASSQDWTDWATAYASFGQNSKFLWQRETTTYTQGKPSTVNVWLISRYGDAGTSVTITSIQYGVSSSQSSEPSYSSTYPTLHQGDWLWTKTTYSDGSSAITKTYIGENGEPADLIELTLSSQTYAENLRLNGTTEVKATVSLQGVYSSGNLSVFSGNTSLSYITKVNSTVKNPPVSSVSVRDGDVVTISIPNTYTNPVTIQLASSTPTASISKVCNPVDETEYDIDFGTVDTLPTSYTDSSGRTCSLLSGDYFVARAVFNIGTDNSVIGYPYIYVVDSWSLLDISDTIDPTDAEKLLNCLSNILSNNAGKQPTDTGYINLTSTSPIYTWCKNFVAQTAVINTLFSRAITLLTGGSFKSAELTYDSSDPRFVSEGFILNSNGEAKLGKAYLRDIKIKCSDSQSVILLETQEYQPSSTSIACSSKTNWSGKDLYNALTSSSTGSYNSGTTYYISKNSEAEETISEASQSEYGIYYLDSGSTSKQGVDGAQFTIPYSGWYYIKSTKTDSSYATACAYITSGGGTTVLSGNSYDGVKTTYNSTYSWYITTICKRVYLTAGTVLTMHVQYIRSRISIGIEKGSIGMFDNNWTTDQVDPGTIKHKSLYRQFRYNCFYSGRLLTSNGFDSNNYKNYASINGWYNNLLQGKQTDLENSTITIDGTSYTVKSVIKSSGLLEFFDSNGTSHTFNGPSTSSEGDDVGWYNISGTLYPVGQKSSLNTHNLNATQNDSDIGADKAYRYVYATKFAGNVNGTNVSDGTQYNVWGAVFN